MLTEPVRHCSCYPPIVELKKKTKKKHTHKKPPQQQKHPDSLLHLVAAVGGSQVDNQTQLAAGVLHKLLLEASLLGSRRPRQSFIQVQQPVQGPTDCNHSPPSSLGNLGPQPSTREQPKHHKLKRC